MPDSQPFAGGRAETATLRMLVVGVAVSVIFSAVVTLAVADPSGRVALPGWLQAVTVVAFVVLVVVGAAAPWLRARVIRRGAAAGVGLFFLSLLLFAPASGVLAGTASHGTVPWAMTAIGGVVVAAVAAGGPRLGWSAIVVWIIVMAWYRALLGGYSLGALANDSQALTTAAALCAISAQALRTSRDLDAATRRAAIAMAEEGAARGRLAARARVASFVHDEVLAALRGAAEGVAGTADAVRLQAQRASAAIDADHGADDWIEHLRVLAAAADAELQVDRAPQAVTPSAHAVRAMTVAARQALENSVRHGGDCVRRVHLDLAATGVTLRIVDDGVGFSTDSIPPGRLGVTTSIIGSMSTVVGGAASVRSQPGRGTTVELSWYEPVDDDFVYGATQVESSLLRTPALVVIALFAVTQTLVAVVASLVAPGTWWVPVLALVGFLLSAGLVLPTLPRRATRGAAALILICVTVAWALLATPPPLTYGSAWFLPTAGFVLVALALGARPMLALGGLLVILAMFTADAVIHGGDPTQLVAVAVRTATIVGLGTLLSVSIVRMRRSTRALARRAVRIVQQREWDAAARRELESHANEVDELAGPLLEKIAAGETLDEADRARAGAVEGRLRDGYRAGRLLRPPLVDAAMRARLRGVDVVLLDDAGDGEIDSATTAAIVAWMHPQLNAAHERFVGRLLPPDRTSSAQVVVDGRPQSFAR